MAQAQEPRRAGILLAIDENHSPNESEMAAKAFMSGRLRSAAFVRQALSRRVVAEVAYVKSNLC